MKFIKSLTKTQYKYLFILVGIALLILDLRIGVVPFPAYEPFKTEAPETVSLVIDHVTGTHMRIDLFSDLIGFLFLLFGSFQFLMGLRDLPHGPQGETKTMRRFRSFGSLLPLISIAILLYIVEKFMPFRLNGNLRFRAEYALYFFGVLFKTLVLLYSSISITRMFETLKNHTYNNVTVLLILLGCGCHLIADILYFFNLMILYWAYIVVSIVTVGFAFYRIGKDLGGNFSVENEE